MKKNSYDQFYNEHIYVFSAIGLKNILRINGFEIYDIETLKVHGGSNRYYIKKIRNKKIKISKKFKKNIALEKKYGLHKFSSYQKFSKNVKESRINLIKLIKSLKKKIKIIGYGASAKAVTILNYFHLKENYLIIFMIQQSKKLVNFYLELELKLLNIKNLKIVIFMFLEHGIFTKKFLKKRIFL